MGHGQSELERSIRDTLDPFLAERYDFKSAREQVKCGGDLWRSLAEELGILGVTAAEEAGGLGGGAGETAAIMELFGKHLVWEPFLPTVLMGARLIQAHDASSGLLAQIASGDLTIAIAHGEPMGGYDLSTVKMPATPKGAEYSLNGEKTVVLYGPCATALIVIARSPEGVAAFLVDASAKGIERTDYRTIGGAPASNIKFNGTTATLLGESNGLDLIEQVFDEATVGLCAEACGVMQQLVDITVEYAKQRKQFGRAIAEFQVLQHRMVDMLIEVKQSAAITRTARAKLDTPDRASVVSAAKSRVGRACRAVSQGAVQLHGGIGIADETPVSHYFRRALMIEQEFGSPEFHLDRYERLQLSDI
jgi:alkylation response protein AidB-like acyl-CoA dehydrogenase